MLWHQASKRIQFRFLGPIVVDDISHNFWSKLFRKKINTIFVLIKAFRLIFVGYSQGLGKCLDDHPTEYEILTYPDLPAGAMYNADLQCRLQFNTTDESVQVCSKIDEICSQLWCRVNDECVTQLRPAASGTNCGRHKVCNNSPLFDIFLIDLI